MTRNTACVIANQGAIDVGVSIISEAISSKGSDC